MSGLDSWGTGSGLIFIRYKLSRLIGTGSPEHLSLEHVLLFCLTFERKFKKGNDEEEMFFSWKAMILGLYFMI